MSLTIGRIRLMKEVQNLEKEPMEDILIHRASETDFHYVLLGMRGEYEGGIYHGVLELAENYPLAPPRLRFFTESGRFTPQVPICTTFTNYHKETWSPMWTIRSILLALVSFFHSQQSGVGALHLSFHHRKALAQRSFKNNLLNPLFCQFFAPRVAQLKHILLKSILVDGKLHFDISSPSPPNELIHSDSNTEEDPLTLQHLQPNPQRKIVRKKLQGHLKPRKRIKHNQFKQDNQPNVQQPQFE